MNFVSTVRVFKAWVDSIHLLNKSLSALARTTEVLLEGILVDRRLNNTQLSWDSTNYLAIAPHFGHALPCFGPMKPPEWHRQPSKF